MTDRASRIASLPDAAFNVMLASPRGLNRILDALAAPVPPTVAEQERWDRDNDGERWDGLN